MSMGRWATLAVLAALVGTPASSAATQRRAAAPAPAVAARDGSVSGCEISPAGTIEVCLTSPPSRDHRDPTVVNRLRQLFRSAGAGDQIRIAMFRWDLRPAADDLLAAQRRGAHVEMVVDHDVRADREGARLLRKLEAYDPGDNAVVVCRGSCLPFSGQGPPPPRSNVNHHKLFLFDIGGVRSVATTSSNIVHVQLRQFNTMLRVVDDRLYDFHLAYYHRLKARSWTVGGDTWSDSDKHSVGLPRGFVYPTSTDPVLRVLRRVSCAPGMRQVDVVVAVIQRNDVRRRLGELQRSGCVVRVVVQRTPLENWVQAPTTLPNGSVVDLRNDRVRTALIHDKAIIIHARIGGIERHAVLTGAANFTCGALLYNDEGMIWVNDEWARARYRLHADDVWAHAHNSNNPDDFPTMATCR